MSTVTTLEKIEQQRIMANEAVVEEAARQVDEALNKMRTAQDLSQREKDRREETEFKLHDIIATIEEFTERFPKVLIQDFAKGEKRTTAQDELDRIGGRIGEVKRAIREGK